MIRLVGGQGKQEQRHPGEEWEPAGAAEAGRVDKVNSRLREGPQVPKGGADRTAGLAKEKENTSGRPAGL